MTRVADLRARVRSNIYESSFVAGQELRSDPEIDQWLADAAFDYITRLPSDALVELIVDANVGAFPWALPADFSKLLEVSITHTVSAVSVTELCYMLNSNESYLRFVQTDGLGAWAQIGAAQILAGPGPITAGTVRYIKMDQNIKNPNADLSLKVQHEEPLVNRATAFALVKINDADAGFFMKAYEDRIAAEWRRFTEQPPKGFVE